MLLENNSYPEDGRVRQEARSLITAGYQVTVIAPKRVGQPWQQMCDQVRVYRFPAPLEADGFLGYLWEYGYSMVAAFVLSLLVLAQHGFDIIHTHNPPDTFVLFVLFYKLLGKQFVFDHHDLAPEMYYARFGGKGNTLVYRTLILFEKLSCRLADHVIATNQSYKNIEMQRGQVPQERITIVRNGPDLSRLRLMDVNPTLRHNDKMMLCYVGEMGYHDGVDYLLRALKCLIDDLNRHNFYCLLVGQGDAWPGLKLLAEQLHLTDHVYFIGWVEPSDVARYLSAADICIAPEPSNPYNDRSTMIKVMEYMAMQKPIVAFDLLEHRASAQEAALYARPNDELDFAQKIAMLMDDAARRDKMGEIGRKRIETQLAWPYQEQQLLNAYATLAGGKNGRQNR